MYCIYTDAEVASEDGNWDHVIPLSLGGANDFTVWSDEAYNSKVGSAVDGAINKDFFIAPALVAAAVKGHNRKVAAPRLRKARIDGRPAQLTLTNKGTKIWDARAGRDLTDEETAGAEMTLSIDVHAFTALRFIAKVALGGGYFVYGDAIRRVIDCETLRHVIDLDVEAAKTDSRFRDCGFKVCDRFHEDSVAGRPGYLYRVLCEQVSRSMLICEVYANGLAFHVGIVGEFIGTLFCPGDTSELRQDGGYEGGHAIILAPGATQRLGFHALLRDLQAAVAEMGEPDPDARSTP